MPLPTYISIASTTVGSGGSATIDIQNIPSTYTDLVLKASLRTSGTNRTGLLSLNNDTANTLYSSLYIYGSGSGVAGGKDSAQRYAYWNTFNSDTADTFAYVEIYIPNYNSSNYKSITINSAEENNGSVAYMMLKTFLWSSTSAINRITLTPFDGSWVQYSTATLYGILKS